VATGRAWTALLPAADNSRGGLFHSLDVFSAFGSPIDLIQYESNLLGASSKSRALDSGGGVGGRLRRANPTLISPIIGAEE
jgi:hypothetical protein